MRTRAERRHKLRVMKKKAKRVLPWAGDKAIKYADHLKMCSCDSCGNRRKIEGESIQELRDPSTDRDLEVIEIETDRGI